MPAAVSVGTLPAAGAAAAASPASGRPRTRASKQPAARPKSRVYQPGGYPDGRRAPGRLQLWRAVSDRHGIRDEDHQARDRLARRRRQSPLAVHRPAVHPDTGTRGPAGAKREHPGRVRGELHQRRVHRSRCRAHCTSWVCSEAASRGGGQAAVHVVHHLENVMGTIVVIDVYAAAGSAAADGASGRPGTGTRRATGRGGGHLASRRRDLQHLAARQPRQPAAPGRDHQRAGPRGGDRGPRAVCGGPRPVRGVVRPVGHARRV